MEFEVHVYDKMGYNMSIFISHPISTLDANINPQPFGPLANMGVSGWCGVIYYFVWKCDIYLLLCLKMWYILIALSENVKYIYYYIWKCDIIQLMTFNEVDTRIY